MRRVGCFFFPFFVLVVEVPVKSGTNGNVVVVLVVCLSAG